MVKTNFTDEERTSIKELVERIHQVDNEVLDVLRKMDDARDLVGGITINNFEWHRLDKELEMKRVIIHENAIDLAQALAAKW